MTPYGLVQRFLGYTELQTIRTISGPPDKRLKEEARKEKEGTFVVPTLSFTPLCIMVPAEVVPDNGRS